MKTTVTKYDFERAFIDANRKENFSYEGLNVLFDYLEMVEEDTGEELELDVIALCCEYSENDIKTIAADYSIDLEGMDDDEAKREAVEAYLQDRTSVCGRTTTGFVYACF